MSTRLRIGARGWEHGSWDSSFYPQGLPPEWRLTYYANAFRAVLVPAERLMASTPAEVAGWAGDVHSGFLFFAELAAAGEADLDAWLDRVAPLGERLGGLVLRSGAGQLSPARVSALSGRWALASLAASVASVASADPAAGGDPPGSPPVPPVWRPGSGAASCVGLLDGEPRGPRELRQVIEAFGAASAGCAEALLCFPGTPGAWQEMERAQVIAGLLGG